MCQDFCFLDYFPRCVQSWGYIVIVYDEASLFFSSLVLACVDNCCPELLELVCSSLSWLGSWPWGGDSRSSGYLRLFYPDLLQAVSVM